MDDYIATVLMDGDTKPTEIINFGNYNSIQQLLYLHHNILLK